MFVFYHLFHRCVEPTPPDRYCSSSSTPPESSATPSDPERDRALLFWWAVFGITLFLRPFAELVIRVIFFSACALLIGTLGGSLNLLVGHAVLRATKYNGYEPPLLSSTEAGSLGGIIVIGPTTLVIVFLIASLGGLKFQKSLSSHIAFFLELASVIAVSAAASSVGVTVILCTHPDNGSPLDATHAARAGALGACILTVPIVSTAAFFVCEAQMMPSVRNEPSSPATYLEDSLGCPVGHVGPTPRTRPRQHVSVHTVAETMGYVLVSLCILTIRLLCF